MIAIEGNPKHDPKHINDIGAKQKIKKWKNRLLFFYHCRLSQLQQVYLTQLFWTSCVLRFGDLLKWKQEKKIQMDLNSPYL